MGRPVRHPGDGWVHCGCGSQHWGLNGAAGLLGGRRTRDPAGIEVLMQLRAGWTHGGGTWGLPGGAVSDGEGPAEAALRECAEETGLPGRALVLGSEHIQTHQDWSYTTFTAQAPPSPAWDALVPLDRESDDLRWVRLSPTADGRSWERPAPGPDAAHGEVPLLAALDAVWAELAALLPAPPGRPL